MTSQETRKENFQAILKSHSLEELRLYYNRGPEEIDLQVLDVSEEAWREIVLEVVRQKMGAPVRLDGDAARSRLIFEAMRSKVSSIQTKLHGVTLALNILSTDTNTLFLQAKTLHESLSQKIEDSEKERSAA